MPLNVKRHVCERKVGKNVRRSCHGLFYSLKYVCLKNKKTKKQKKKRTKVSEKGRVNSLFVLSFLTYLFPSLS
jgi:competence transcription factor ComK